MSVRIAGEFFSTASSACVASRCDAKVAKPRLQNPALDSRDITEKEERPGDELGPNGIIQDGESTCGVSRC